jgi:eukaryotic-like serine/threonine-protein kinase
MSGSLSPGTVVAGRYRLDRVLGQGGMGVVWAATHTITRRGVAMKFLKGPAHARPEMRRRFLREARAAATVQHPSVVEVHDVFELDDETPVMVMDLLVGETLGQRIASQGPLSVHQVASILLPVVSAVGTAHSRGVVHRDLKPENIFLAENEEGQTEIKVLDFGIAKLANLEGEAVTQSQLTGTGSMLGTPCYSAPEQLFGEKIIDHRADVWALGVVLYECLSNQLPVYGENLGQILKMLTSGEILPLERLVPNLPADVIGLVGRMLSRPLDQRPKDMREVLEVLQRYSNLSVRAFGEAKSQPPPLESHPSAGANRRAPVHSREVETVVASALKTTPEAGLDTASPHAVSQDASPRSRKLVVLAGAAFAAGLIGLLAWQLGGSRIRTETPAGAVQAAALSTTSVASAIAPETVAAPVATPEASSLATPPAAPVAASSASSDPVAARKAAPQVRPGAAAKPVAAKPDSVARPPEPDPSKAATPKRPGGLIEDVPF